jgi:hypothetical protein
MIDFFSEMIEGELENEDQIILLACKIHNYISDSELKEMIQLDIDILSSLKEILLTRVEEKEI